MQLAKNVKFCNPKSTNLQSIVYLILTHCFQICICVVVDINRNALTDNVLNKSLLTESVSTTLY